jgi:hypothetical protein
LLKLSNFRPSSELPDTFTFLNQKRTNMKKVLMLMVLMLSVIAVNAQSAKTTSTKAKSMHTTVKVADLPKGITDNVTKDYAGFTIKDATSVTSNNVVSYHVVIAKGADTQTLVYDKDGVFVRKLPSATAMHHTAKRK